MLIIRVKRLLELKWESKKKRRDSILLALFVVDRKGNSEKLGGWFSRYPLLLFLRGSWDGKASGLLSMGGMWFLLLYFQSLVGWCNLNRVSVKYSIFFLFFYNGGQIHVYLMGIFVEVLLLFERNKKPMNKTLSSVQLYMRYGLC